MSIKDVIKKSFLESDAFNQAITASTVGTMILDLAVALLIGLLIYLVYRSFFKGVVYSRNFAMTLVGMTVLTCAITLAISTNVVISLGMVGALSIVRYRTAIKEPLDLLYVFWAITSGIAIGASMYILVGLAFLIMFMMIVLFSRGGIGRHAYIMVVHYQGDQTGDAILKQLKGLNYSVRSRILRGEALELTVQVNCRSGNTAFAEKIRSLEQVQDVALLAFNGEYHG
ncbi:MAG: DUF4956 domain-containing protein [Oscillospiraceae bacterium]|nr:DUF4956 domain-containing protein [Oscillospiraceae bacterium]MDD4369123.1 DUF4956 domain-containing protein [Oscillospiraceae bacterium]